MATKTQLMATCFFANGHLQLEDYRKYYKDAYTSPKKFSVKSLWKDDFPL